MMSASVLWLDTEHAKVFKISADAVEKKEVKLHGMSHSNNKQETHKDNLEQHFFKEVCSTIGKVEELLVFGPGMAKTHFRTFLEKNHKHDLYKNLVGVEPLDSLTDNQILESSRKFFKKIHQFTHPF
jgi:stalled ribosome rescue protein Dom34